MNDFTEALAAIQSRATNDPGQKAGDAQTDRDYLLALCVRLLAESELTDV